MTHPTNLKVRIAVLALAIVGCSSKPDKATVEKRVKEALTKSSPEWKNVSYDTRANDIVSVVLATRSVDGKSYNYSFTGGKTEAGVGVQDPRGKWLCKYRYLQGKEVDATKMDGSDEDIAKFRPTAVDFATAVSGAVP